MEFPAPMRYKRPVTRVTEVAASPTKPVLIYDGECNFCRRWIARWREATGDRVEYVPFQDPGVAARFPEIPREQFEESVQFIEKYGGGGIVTSGAKAALGALSRSPNRWHSFLSWAYGELPGFAPAAEWTYRFVARHRSAFSWITRLLWGERFVPPRHQLVRWLFLRMLGVIYLIAFVSLWTQIDGLVGSNGITPARDTMREVREHVAEQGIGPGRYWRLPTLCWFSASDGFLHFLCGGGAALAVLLIVGVAPALVAFLLWAFYLSLSCVCDLFLGYQWDALLLETGFLAIFFAPLQLLPRRPSAEARPSAAALWLLRLLLFKLMFFSGVVKLRSGDPTWHNLSALSIHYETQPLPTWIGWYAHQLPDWMQQMSVFVMFVVELAVPFLIFAPRRWRLPAFWPLVGLQLLIAATGNYCFFNLLTLALCALMLDDAILEKVKVGGASARRPALGNAAGRRAEAPPTFTLPCWPCWIVIPLTVLLLTLNLTLLCRLFSWPTPLRSLLALASPLRSVNSYGLFAVMTTSRPEIIVEGSVDGANWRAYEFRYKPGDVFRAPAFVAPHQPRLDWQMWFAALQDYRGNPWFLRFCERLLRGSPDVIRLLQHNPFPDAPPRFIRALVYDYRFTDLATKRRDGTWWRRELRGAYCPELTLRQ